MSSISTMAAYPQFGYAGYPTASSSQVCSQYAHNHFNIHFNIHNNHFNIHFGIFVTISISISIYFISFKVFIPTSVPVVDLLLVIPSHSVILWFCDSVILILDGAPGRVSISLVFVMIFKAPSCNPQPNAATDPPSCILQLSCLLTYRSTVYTLSCDTFA